MSPQAFRIKSIIDIRSYIYFAYLFQNKHRIDDSNLFLWEHDYCQIHHSSLIWSTNERSSTLKGEAGRTNRSMTSGSSLEGNAKDSLGSWLRVMPISSPNVFDVAGGALGITSIRSVPVQDVEFSNVLHLFCTWFWITFDISYTFMYIRVASLWFQCYYLPL